MLSLVRSPKTAVHEHICLFFDSDYTCMVVDEIVDLLRGGRCRSVGHSYRLKRMGGPPLGLQTAEPNRHVISPKNIMRCQGNASFTACDERGS